MDFPTYRFWDDINQATVANLTRWIRERIGSGTNNMNVVLTSMGGMKESAIAAFEEIRSLDAEVCFYGVGYVQSAALILFCSGKHRFAVENTIFMMHHGMVSMNMVNAIQIESRLSEIHVNDEIEMRILTSVIETRKYQQRLELFREHYEKGKSFDSHTAVEMGIVHEIVKKFPTGL